MIAVRSGGQESWWSRSNLRLEANAVNNSSEVPRFRYGKMAGAVADGIHVHPVHSVHYLNTRLLPSVAVGAAAVGRDPSEVDLLIPSIIVPGDTSEERADLLTLARTRIGFYGATKNYAYQFDDLGFDGVSAELNRHLKADDSTALANE